jgi:hypothetical protein
MHLLQTSSSSDAPSSDSSLCSMSSTSQSVPTPESVARGTSWLVRPNTCLVYSAEVLVQSRDILPKPAIHASCRSRDADRKAVLQTHSCTSIKRPFLRLSLMSMFICNLCLWFMTALLRTVRRLGALTACCLYCTASLLTADCRLQTQQLYQLSISYY